MIYTETNALNVEVNVEAVLYLGIFIFMQGVNMLSSSNSGM